MTRANENLSDRRKFALIIANDKYKRSENKFNNSIKNGRELYDLLKTINFDVTIHTDIKDKKNMADKIKDFVDKITNGDLVLFYFAGHAYQVNGKNYMIPTEDKKIEKDDDVDGYGTEVNGILERLIENKPANNTILILDCCRPYILKKASKSNTSQNNGLHPMNAPSGTFIQYACAANETTTDDLFAKHLLKNITKENVNVLDLFQSISKDVEQESGGKQHPLSINGLAKPKTIYFNQVRPPTPSYKNEKLQKIIEQKKNHKRLTLASMNLNPQDIGILVQGLLQDNTTLTYLHLYDNQLGVEGAEYLSQALQNNKTIKNLSLFNNRLGDEGIKHLCNILQNNTTITKLDLSMNQITAQGAKYLSQALENNKTITKLDLAVNRLKDDGVQYLSNILQNNQTITELNLNDNRINDKGAKYISNALQKNQTLIRLYLYKNKIGNEGTKHLSDALENNNTLALLDLKYNNIGPNGRKTLDEFNKANRSLFLYF